MNILFLAEQNFSLIGGTITYTKMLLKEFDKTKHNITFIYPSSMQEENIIDGVSYIGLSVGCAWDEFLGWKYRHLFVLEVNRWLEIKLCNYKIDIIHILHGFFLLEGLNYKLLKRNGVSSLITIHNIPPREGGDSWKGDRLHLYFRNLFFQYLRKLIFKYRLKRSNIDCFIVPSKPVLFDLRKLLMKQQQCISIPHGFVDVNIVESIATTAIKKDGKVHLLTVGGIAPHKNQLMIPEIGIMLQNQNFDFEWNIIGPIRNSRYATALEQKIQEFNLTDRVLLKYNVSNESLANQYLNSSIYVHLSFEEGFCFTVLDAALYGLPIVGLNNIGEIPEIINRSKGCIVEKNSPSSFFSAIISIINSEVQIDSDKIESLRKYYSWKTSVQTLEDIYVRLKKHDNTDD